MVVVHIPFDLMGLHYMKLVVTAFVHNQLAMTHILGVASSLVEEHHMKEAGQS